MSDNQGAAERVFADAPAGECLVDRLRGALNNLERQYPDGEAFSREHAIALLDCLYQTLASSTLWVEHAANDPEDITVLVDHPEMALLHELKGMLQDLDNAKTHRVFETPKVSKANALTTRERGFRSEAVKFVYAHQKAHKLRSFKAAAEEVEKLAQRKLKRSAALTAKQLILWKNGEHRLQRTQKNNSSSKRTRGLLHG